MFEFTNEIQFLRKSSTGGRDIQGPRWKITSNHQAIFLFCLKNAEGARCCKQGLRNSDKSKFTTEKAATASYDPLLAHIAYKIRTS